MASEPSTDDFFERLQRVEGLVERLERHGDPALRDAARELLRTVLELHARGIKRLLELTSSEQVSAAAAGDPALFGLLGLHGLHPVSLVERVRLALAELEPKLSRAGARCDGLSVEGGSVRVRLHGSPSLEPLVRESLAAAAPDAADIVVDVASALVSLRLGRDEHTSLGEKA